MKMFDQRFVEKVLLLFALVIVTFTAAQAQTTAFTYQGRLSDGNVAANGNYSMKFRLYDAETAGNEVGSEQTALVAVTNGAFTVKLDFSERPFLPGAEIWLEIQVGSTVLSPRQKLTSSPFAVRAVNANKADALSALCDPCVTSSQLVSVDAAKISGTVASADTANTANTATNALNLGGTAASNYVQTGSTEFVRSQTTQQTGANFNIAGTGTASIFNAATQYNINGSRVLSTAGSGNLFAGLDAGQSNTTGANNSFVGSSTGRSNTTSNNNSFFGAQTGYSNTVGGANSFFGAQAGYSNTTGASNSFFGAQTGYSNTTGTSNSFFGLFAGQLNTTGGGNSFVGTQAGYSNTTGYDNAFFGRYAGESNSTGTNNTAIGQAADFGSSNLTYATAIGSGAVVLTSNTIQLGRGNGTDKVVVPGLGAATNSTYLCRNSSNQISTCLGTPLAERETEIAGMQKQIDEQAKQIAEQKALVEALRALVCQSNAAAAVCREQK